MPIPVVTLYAIRMDHIADGRRMCPIAGHIDIAGAMAKHDPTQIYRGQWGEQQPPHDGDAAMCGIVECELLEGAAALDMWPDDEEEHALCERHQAPDREDEEP